MKSSDLESIKQRYLSKSKHGYYQRIPDFVKKELSLSDGYIQPLWRDDQPRLKLLHDSFDFNKINSISDIGANIGYFSLSLAHTYPGLQVKAFEGNSNHSNFIKDISKYFSIENLFVENIFIDGLTSGQTLVADLQINLNVLHHLGYDHMRQIDSLETFHDYALLYLQNMRRTSKYLFFQMGYNWGGKKDTPIIPLENDIEKIFYTKNLLEKASFIIKTIALPRLNFDKVRYDYRSFSGYQIFRKSKDQINEILLSLKIQNNSEFFRRPIFICE